MRPNILEKMKILIINAGSSSIKFQLMDSAATICLYKGIVELPPEKINKNTYYKGIKFIVNFLRKEKIIKNLDEIKLIGHRVVHGGEKYKKPTVISSAVIKEIRKLCQLAPLHNPANLEGILACKKIFSKAKQIAVFDTAFYATMPEKAYLYALPYHLYKKYGIRRYGFHGTSHQYVVNEALKILEEKEGRNFVKKAKIISCHMGNGISITASIGGHAIDTSMGFTPLEGIPMGTRCGDIDPAIAFYLIKNGISAEKIDEILNHESGFKGICGKSNMKDIWELMRKKNKMARLAIEILCYRIAKYIGAYASAMNGLDAIIFTAGIGENAWYIRSKICKYLNYLGVKIDEKKNRKNKEFMICDKSSKIYVFVIPTNEEMLIAKESLKIH